MYNLGQKATDILRVAGTDMSTPQRMEAWGRVCAEYSEKAVLRKLRELTTRGYTNYGTSPRGAWLTDKGRAALAEVMEEESDEGV